MRRNLSLCSGLDHIQWTRYNACEATGGHCSQDLETEANLLFPAPALGKPPFLFVKGELQGRKWEVSDNCGLVARIKGPQSFFSGYGLCRIPCRLVVVAGVEEWIVVSTL